MDADARIGHLSFIQNGRLVMRSRACIGHMNICRGPFSIWLGKSAALGNRNIVNRGAFGITTGSAQLRLGELSKITASHKIDCTASVIFGSFTTLAGSGSQVWTHGYVHDDNGPGRYRVDGSVEVGNNVYIGSRAILTGGVHISDGVIVGAGVTVASDLCEPGLYVAATLRRLSRPEDPDKRPNLERLNGSELIETVYRKVRPNS